jgi:tetratricopeptide (TPR) repeat protein
VRREAPPGGEEVCTEQGNADADLPPDFPNVLIEAAHSLRREEYSEALARLEKAAVVSKEDEAIRLILMGECYEELDTLPRVIWAYRKAHSVAPSVAVSSLRLGVVEYKSGDLERAKEYLEQYVTFEPGNAEAYYYLYLCYFAEDNPVQLARCLKQLIVLDAPKGIWLEKLNVGPVARQRKQLEGIGNGSPTSSPPARQ